MADLPPETIAEAERLTRLARQAVDDSEAEAYRRERDELLAEHGYIARIREEDRDVLVCYPEEWVDDSGTVYPDRIDDIDRGVERALEGPGEGDWETVADHNDEIADAVAADYGRPHGETARALVAFASNHYAKPIEDLTGEELIEFKEEYFPRNAWPSDAQKRRLSESIDKIYEKADAQRPD